MHMVTVFTIFEMFKVFPFYKSGQRCIDRNGTYCISGHMCIKVH